MIDDACRRALAEIVGERGVRDGTRLAALAPGFHADNLKAGLAVAPATTREVAAILALCHERRIPVVPQAGRTGLAGAAASAPGDLIVQLDRMASILDIDPLAGIAVLEAGVTLQALQEAAAEHGLAPGIDLAARGSATIGGMISTNAGGNEAFRSGVMRQRVLGLEAVLAGGAVMSDLKRVAKANEGYDLKQLFIGAEGTLGIVTRAVLRLEPAAARRETALVSFGDAARAVALFASLRRSAAVRLRAAEIMWRDYALAAAADLRLDALARFVADAAVCAIFEVDGEEGACDAFASALADAARDGLVADALLAASGRERADIWKLREDSWTIERVMPHGLWYDVSVPLGTLDAYVGRLRAGVESLGADLRVYAFGHLGDGNLHLTISNGTDIATLYGQVGEIVYAGLAEAGGSFSAEHGIGLEKRAALARNASPERLDLMRRIKTAFDPHGIMNPGKVLMP